MTLSTRNWTPCGEASICFAPRVKQGLAYALLFDFDKLIPFFLLASDLRSHLTYPEAAAFMGYSDRSYQLPVCIPC